MTSAQSEATKILFDLVSRLDSRFRPLAGWYSSVVAKLDVWYTSEGNQGVKRMKDILSAGWQIILGETAEPVLFCKQTDGIPNLVKPLVNWAKGHKSDARLLSGVLSLVRVTDLFQGQELDSTVMSGLRTINDSTLPQTAKSVIEEFIPFLKLFLETFPEAPVTNAIRNRLRLEDRHATYYRESRGPNGPLTASAHRDVLSLEASQCKNGQSLMEAVIQLEREIIAQQTRGWRPSTELDQALESWDGFESLQHSECPGKISLVPEKGGKVRLVAQPDYWSQLALRPIHDWLCNVLKALPSDCTYDQRSAIPKIAQWQCENRETYSFDQSSCTDLFPFDLQLCLLEYRFGTPLSEAVKTVMVDREWEVRLPQSQRTVKVRWPVGQPMGLLASWPLMAVSHHLLVQYSYWLSRGRSFDKIKSPYSRYVICGDDIVIADKAVANAYRSVVKRLGMKINLSKSHISGGSTGVPSVSEFAKIIVWKGQPLFPIRPNMVLSAVKNWRNAVPLLIDLSRYDGYQAKLSVLTRVIRTHFPQGKKYLAPFLTIPSEFGGCGFRDSEPMRKKFQLVHADQIHPWLYYLGCRIRSGLLLEQRTMKLIPLTDSAVLPWSVIRKHPLYDCSQELQNRNQGTSHLLHDAVPSVPAICLEIVENGLGPYSRFLIEESSEIVPHWESSRERERSVRRNITWWEKAYRTDNSKGYHSFPSTPGPLSLRALRESATSGLDNPEVLSEVSEMQLSLVQDAMLARRVKQDHEFTRDRT